MRASTRVHLHVDVLHPSLVCERLRNVSAALVAVKARRPPVSMQKMELADWACRPSPWSLGRRLDREGAIGPTLHRGHERLVRGPHHRPLSSEAARAGLVLVARAKRPLSENVWVRLALVYAGKRETGWKRIRADSHVGYIEEHPSEPLAGACPLLPWLPALPPRSDGDGIGPRSCHRAPSLQVPAQIMLGAAQPRPGPRQLPGARSGVHEGTPAPCPDPLWRSTNRRCAALPH